VPAGIAANVSKSALTAKHCNPEMTTGAEAPAAWLLRF